MTLSTRALGLPRRTVGPLLMSLALVAGTGSAAAHEPTAVQIAKKDEPKSVSTVLLETSTHGDGVPLVYPTGKPLITARITEIPPGVATPEHRHPIPLVVYMLEGELTLRGENGRVQVVKEGEAFMEATDWHFGRNEGNKTVRLLAVYVGEVGAPLSVRPAN